MNYRQSLDPIIFEENRLSAHALFSSQMSVTEHSLNGPWRIRYFNSPNEATTEFLEIEKVEGMDSIIVPSPPPPSRFWNTSIYEYDLPMGWIK